MPCTVQKGAELGAPGDEYNKSPCREGSPRLLKDKTQLAAVSLLLCHFAMKERWWGLFFSKTSWRIKDNNTSPHGKFNRFLSPFSSKFSDLNFASYVLYIYLCYDTCHITWTWVTDDIDMFIRFSCRSYINNSCMHLTRKIGCEESSVIVSH